MPTVTFRVTPEGLTQEKKRTLIRRATDILVEELGKNPDTTIVLIDEVQTDNWGLAGEQVTRRRARDFKP
ncbi:MAG: 4-oxalocrotonate tautomerase family protein [Litorimonas sp.]